LEDPTGGPCSPPQTHSWTKGEGREKDGRERVKRGKGREEGERVRFGPPHSFSC